MLELTIINIASLVAVAAGGVTMGVYLAFATKCGYTPSLVTLIVLGWSFLIPLGVTQVWMNVDGVDPQRVGERMILWALFSLHARIGVRLLGHWRFCKDMKK